MNLLIYAANLHVGGGVQVATSFIEEVSCMPEYAADITVWASSTVDENLTQMNFNKLSYKSYEVTNHYGISALWSGASERTKYYDCIFIIFGPHYLWNIRATYITGFAQAWIAYPENEVYSILPFWRRSLYRLKFYAQKLIFRSAKFFVVELEHVRDALVRQGIASQCQIKIVHNCISSIYFSPERWKPVVLPNGKNNYRLGFIGRNYRHKNTVIFTQVIKLLRNHHGLDVDFYVTFTQEEWRMCDPEFRQLIKNVGPLSVAQCPEFYRQMDGIVFPSLLECFSATPLESMVMMCPLFASDRPFVRDICFNFANYFDPLNPEHIAEVIAKSFSKPKDEMRLQNARLHALNFSNAGYRAKKYLEFANEIITNKNII